MIVATLLFTVLLWISYVIFNRINHKYEYFKKRGVPHLKPLFLLGNSAQKVFRRTSGAEYAKHLYNIFALEKITGFFDFTTPAYLIRDPELIKQMAVKDFDYFQDHKSFIDEDADDLFGNTLLFLRGQKWRDMRATLSPAFTGSKIRLMFDLVSECAFGMTKYLLKESENSACMKIEMKELFSRCSTDVIATCAFGLKVNSLENKNNEFLLSGKKVFKFSIVNFILIRLLPKLMRLLKINFVDSSTSKYFRSLVLDTIDAREREKIYRPDMINIMMQVRKGNLAGQSNSDSHLPNNDGFAAVQESHIGKADVTRSWTDTELAAQCFLFFLAGFDTSSTVLSLLTYGIALNPDVQATLFEEINDSNNKLNGQPLNYDALQKLKYLDQVLSETMRMWPPFAITDRMCVKDYTFDYNDSKLVIEKNTQIIFSIFGMHYDPKYFPNPDKFDPERFSDENKKYIVPGTYLPFGVGPRNCIGSRFAILQVKTLIYYFVLNFEVKPYEETQIPLKYKKLPLGIPSATEKGVHLEVIRRQS